MYIRSSGSEILIVTHLGICSSVINCAPRVIIVRQYVSSSGLTVIHPKRPQASEVGLAYKVSQNLSGFALRPQMTSIPPFLPKSNSSACFESS